MTRCILLDWDTEHFGFRTARLEGSPRTERELGEALCLCRSEAIKCVYFLADSDDTVGLALAEDQGFRVVDVRIELDRDLPDASLADKLAAGIGAVRPDQVPAVLESARTRFGATRFSADRRFPRDRVEALYSQWVQRGLSGAGRTVLCDERAAGFIVCAHTGPGIIELVAVNADKSGTGLATSLVQAAHGVFQSHHCATAQVVTQGRNIAAQRLYQRCGYRTASVRLWCHLWLD